MSSRAFRIVLLVSAVLLMGNLYALADGLLHPETSYFDSEHLIVGSVAAFLAAILLGTLAIFPGALRESEEKARAITDAAIDAIITVDSEGRVLRWNPASERMFGHTAQEAIGKELHRLIVPDEYRDASQKGLRRFRATGQGSAIGKTLELTAIRKDGTEFPVELSVSAVKMGGEWNAIGIVRDITERKQMEEALRQQTRRDPLTGVLNHGAIVEELQSLISDGGDGSSHSVAMVDVNGLKAANDTYGHQVGDAVLVAVAHTLASDGAIVGRYAGDEFLVVLPGADRDAAERYRDAVVAALAQAELTDPESGASVPVAVGIGLVTYPAEAGRIEDLIRLADSEMYAAKRQRPVGAAGRTLPRPLSDDRAAKMVGEIVPLLTSPGDLDDKLRLVAHRLSLGAGYDAVNFALFRSWREAPTALNTFARAPDQVVEAWDREQRDAEEVPLRRILEHTRRPIILDDLLSDQRVTDTQRELVRAAGLRSALVAPMICESELIGHVSVASKLEAAFGPRDAEFLMTVATQVTAIVRMAALLGERTEAEERIRESQEQTVMLLAAAAEAHDQTTGLHLQGVCAISEALARELGYSEEDARELGLAAVLHDIGKVRVPDVVLSTVGQLTDSEWDMLKRHTVWGEEFLKGRPGFELAAAIARSHHERWDGSGYPDGLVGEAIPEAATIVAVADAFDAMTSDRPYRPARSAAAAAREIVAGSGTQLSPKVVEALARLHRRKLLPLIDRKSREQKAAA